MTIRPFNLSTRIHDACCHVKNKKQEGVRPISKAADITALVGAILVVLYVALTQQGITINPLMLKIGGALTTVGLAVGPGTHSLIPFAQALLKNRKELQAPDWEKDGNLSRKVRSSEYV